MPYFLISRRVLTCVTGDSLVKSYIEAAFVGGSSPVDPVRSADLLRAQQSKDPVISRPAIYHLHVHVNDRQKTLNDRTYLAADNQADFFPFESIGRYWRSKNDNVRYDAICF